MPVLDQKFDFIEMFCQDEEQQQIVTCGSCLQAVLVWIQIEHITYPCLKQIKVQATNLSTRFS